MNKLIFIDFFVKKKFNSYYSKQKRLPESVYLLNINNKTRIA